jgi:hypothetical protein
LPAPLDPTTPRTRPAGSSNETSFKIKACEPECRQAPVGVADRGERSPSRDHLLDRSDRPYADERRRHEDADADLPFDVQQRAERIDDQDLGMPKEADAAEDEPGAILRDRLGAARRGAVARPALRQSGGHSHGLDRIGIAPDRVRQVELARRGLAGDARRPRHENLVEHRKAGDQRHADEAEQSEHRVQQERCDDEQGAEDRIEAGLDQRAADGVAQGVEVGQHVGARAGNMRPAQPPVECLREI